MPKSKNLISFVLITFILVFSCKKIELNRINKVATGNVTITNTRVEVKGTIIDVGEEGITKFGHCYSTHTNPTISDTKTEYQNAISGFEFTSALTTLAANTTYYIRSYASNDNQTVYGDEKSFILNNFNSIAIVASNEQIQSETTLSVDGTISGTGSLNIVDYGHCWATHTSPSINDNHNSNGNLNSTSNYTSSLTNLNLETNYYIRAFLKLDNNTFIYSNEISILIPDLKVITDTFSFAGNTAVLGGTIQSLGVLPVIDHGHCWSTTTSNPNFNNNLLSLGTTSTPGPFYNNLQLVNGTTYYFRAYARKGNSIKYGAIKKIIY